MGTIGKCIKCGAEHYVNTTMLKNIKSIYGIKPSEWIKRHYICRKCKSRMNNVEDSSIDNIIEKISSFNKKCREIYKGLYYNGQITKETWYGFVRKIKETMDENGVSNYKFITSNNVIVGISYIMPIIGEMHMLLSKSD